MRRLFFHQSQVLNKRYAADSNDDLQVAQRLCQPEAILALQIFGEDAADNVQLREQGHENLRLVEVVLEVLVQQVFVLRVVTVKEVDH